MELVRQTDFSIERLREISLGLSNLPKCFGINELGVMACIDPDESNRETAKDALREALTDEDPYVRFPAYGFLLALGEETNELCEFQLCPENGDMLKQAAEGAKKLKSLIPNRT